MISITPQTELFSILGYSVQTWGTIVALGIAVSLFFLFRKAKQNKLLEQSQMLIVYILFSGLIGARIIYILLNPSEFPNFLSLFEVWKGGIVSWGVFLGGFLGIMLFKITSKIKSSELKNLLDLMAPYFILAVAIGRIGCFLRGCCFGIASNLPWAIVYIEGLSSQAGLTAVHPTQLYHAILDFLIFIILLKINKKKEFLNKNKQKSRFGFFNKAGGTFLLFILLYSVERFFVDFLRFHPASEYIGRITITQIIFTFLFFIALFLLIKIRTPDSSTNANMKPKNS